MAHPLLDVARIDQPPAAYLKSVGRVFAVYGEATQDSGNVSYGVQIGQERYFVKTAGEPQVKAYFDHAARVELLHNAVRLYESCPDPPLSRLHGVVDSPHGPLLVYDWCSGELLRAPAAQRQDPATAHQRFRRLSPE